jgi:hypothetical protein
MALRDVIESAFAGVPHPGDDRITVCSGGDADEVLACFRGRTSGGFSAQQLRHHDYALSYFSEDALLYFLPAFLIALVEAPETADTIQTRILWMFTVPSGHKPRDREAFDRLITRLTSRQRDALLQVFEHLHSQRIYSADDVAALLEVFSSHAIHAA